MFWAFLFVGMILITLLGAVYLVRRIAHFEFIKRLSDGKVRRARLISSAILAAVAAVLAVTMGVWNMMICYIHLLLIWLICDGAAWLMDRLHCALPRNYVGGAAILLTAAYLAFGWYGAHHVRMTHYDIVSEKDLGLDSLRIVGFADSHLGTTFHHEKFAEYIDEMNAQEPDAVVIAGDFVDDDSSYEDMVKCCEALGKLKTTYGVYYVFGNHDKGYFASGRGYSEADVADNLRRAGVTVLMDEAVPLAGNVYILGRLDAQVYRRESMESLKQEYADDKFVIVLDHEPNDYAAESAAGADLVISGHTHGGQFFPLNRAGEWMGMNDRTYGYEKRGGTQFLVTSGISDWALKFKTGCVSEYIVVDIK